MRCKINYNYIKTEYATLEWVFKNIEPMGSDFRM